MVQINFVRSKLRPVEGGLSVQLFQDEIGRRLLGDRDALRGAQDVRDVGTAEANIFADRLARTREGWLSVLSYHRGVAGSRKRLEELSLDRTIVTLGGIDAQGNNLALVASAGCVYEQAKASLSSQDGDDGVVAGDALNFFTDDEDPEMVRWAVINCHEYTHVDIVRHLLDQRIELLVVLTMNTATQLYWEYATADVHRLFCFIVIVNVAELGGSAVFVPFRRIGKQPNATFKTSGQIFSTRGPSETSAVVELDFAELRRLRSRYREQGLAGPKGMESERYLPLAPSEHFMHTYDRSAGSPQVDHIRDVQMRWNSDEPLVALAQLKSVPVDDYVACRYRLDDLAASADRAGVLNRFEESVKIHLESLERRLSLDANGLTGLDFLVMPEVFVSRRFATDVIATFCAKFNTVAICGVDYPMGENAENRNSAMIISSDGVIEEEYDKITRSQYDALALDKSSSLPMQRGGTLYRFTNLNGHAFGVLICYDFSHFDLVHRINLEGRDTPLDVLFVIAHNPFGDLYRTCCVADSHRFYQHVVLCNVASYGVSGVYAPVRTDGPRQTLVDAGMRNETIALVRLRLNEQRAARSKTDAQLHSEAANGGRMMRRPGVFARRLLDAGWL
ncbi:hypothetical protein [Sphingomonas panni]|uniref:hypothetical protein n=1 Tax=Sphingomonas panni TaxID=237612 RepID=UPI001F5B56C7|nr:hypothetical protein [Sphingomonas panni]